MPTQLKVVVLPELQMSVSALIRHKLLCGCALIACPHVRLAMLGGSFVVEPFRIHVTDEVLDDLRAHGCAMQDGPIRYPALAGDKALSWTGCGASCPTGPMSLTGGLGSASSMPSTNSNGTARLSGLPLQKLIDLVQDLGFQGVYRIED